MFKLQRLQYFLAILGVLAITSCTKVTDQSESLSNSSLNLYTKYPNFTKGLELVTAGNLEKASTIFNQLLFDHPMDANLHTINAFIYQTMADQGDDSKLPLAKVGYKKALSVDNNNTFAILQLAKIAIIEKKHIDAQEYLASLLMLEPENIDAHYYMAVSSYHAADLSTAIGSVDKIIQKDPKSPKYLRAAAFIYAACGKHDKADKYLSAYKKLVKNVRQNNHLSRRISDWKSAHNQKLILASSTDSISDYTQPSDTVAESNYQDSSNNAENVQPSELTDQSKSDNNYEATDDSNQNSSEYTSSSESSDNFAASSSPEKDDSDSKAMFVIDAMIMSIEDTSGTSKGNNVIDNFQLLLTGSGWKPDSGGNLVESITQNTLANLRFVSREITYEMGKYSMNIMNSSHSHVELVARPTLTAKLGSEAKFFAGRQQFISSGSNLTDTPIGTTLKVTPTDFDGEYVTLDIEMIASTLAEQLNNLSNATADDTTVTFNKTNSTMRTTIRAKYGETVILGGITQRVDNSTESGVPLLESIPLIQYFFSHESTTHKRNSIIFLITPSHYEKNISAMKKIYAQSKESKPNLQRLKNRYKDWYGHVPNSAFVLNRMHLFYDEFRVGDIHHTKWGDGTENYPFFIKHV